MNQTISYDERHTHLPLFIVYSEGRKQAYVRDGRLLLYRHKRTHAHSHTQTQTHTQFWILNNDSMYHLSKSNTFGNIDAAGPELCNYWVFAEQQYGLTRHEVWCRALEKFVFCGWVWVVGSRRTQSQIIWVSGAQFTTFSSEEHSCPHKQTNRHTHTQKITHTYTNMQKHTHTYSLLVCRVFFWCYYVHFHWAECRTSARLETSM